MSAAIKTGSDLLKAVNQNPTDSSVPNPFERDRHERLKGRQDAAPKLAMLPLDEARSVTLTSKNNSFTYHLRRLTCTDWEEYFQGIIHQTLNRGNVREEIYEADTAALELVDRTLVSADGYGDGKLPEGWKTAVPIKHRVAVSIALRSVAAVRDAATTPSLCDSVEVKLDATWPIAHKAMQYSGLIHRFRQPSIADLKRFNFEAARVKVRGNAQDGVTTYPSRSAIAMKIYDDLIESVDGYSVHGKPLQTPEQIAKEMDGAHKAAAALQLFVGDDEVTITGDSE